MKIALLGKGKTGAEVLKLDPNVTVFDSKDKPKLESLSGHDIIISFLPGPVFSEYIQLLIESKIPVITGSTGFDWPKDIDKTLINNKLSWIYAHNFSLGMNIVKKMIETLSKATELFPDSTFKIHEIHHTKKQDAPSGTAISFEKWLGHKAEITSSRTGDVIGDHELTFECDDEVITLNHSAKDRSIFARGALWAAQIMNEDSNIPLGLNSFNEIVKNKLKL
jgi:4-hydroxy-tetrahydrodipicolinate reductase